MQAFATSLMQYLRVSLELCEQASAGPRHVERFISHRDPYTSSIAVQRPASQNQRIEGLHELKDKLSHQLERMRYNALRRGEGSPLMHMRELFSLSREEEELFLLTLAPYLDPTFSQLYRRLGQQEGWATLALYARTLGRDLQPTSLYALVAENSTLRRWQLVHISENIPWLAERRLEVPETLWKHLIYEQHILHNPKEEDSRDPRLQDAQGQHTLEAMKQAFAIQRRLRKNLHVILRKSTTRSLRWLLQAFATAHGRACVLLPITATSHPEDIRDALRETRLRSAFLSVDISTAQGDIPSALTEELAFISQHLPFMCVVLPSSECLPPFPENVDLIELKAPNLSPETCLALWNSEAPSDCHLEPGPHLDLLSQRDDIGDAMRNRVMTLAAGAARLRGGDTPTITRRDIARSLRSVAPAEFSGLVDEIDIASNLGALVLSLETQRALMQIVSTVEQRALVCDEWGVGGGASNRGLSALFHGEPGTGKSATARWLALQLGRELYQINLANVVSKYIGETEKNLEQLFIKAEQVGAVLLFDEADALFTHRTEVKSSTDRYANLEVNYLLQRIESYNGLCLLTTNHDQNIDQAFLRRFHFRIEFTLPNAEQRQEIWRRMFPKPSVLANDVDFESLADFFELSGGFIRKAALQAAHAAAARPQSERLINATDLWDACSECYRDLGKLIRALG